MGRANKNIISHTNSRYCRAIDGDEKIQKGTPNVRCGNRCGAGNVYCQCKKTYFPSTNQLFGLDYSDKLVYCAEALSI